jgi:TolB-like protein
VAKRSAGELADRIETLARLHRGRVCPSGPGTRIGFGDGSDALAFARALHEESEDDEAGLRIAIHGGAGAGPRLAATAQEFGRAGPPGTIVVSNEARAGLPSEAAVPLAPLSPMSVDGTDAPAEAFRVEPASGPGAAGWEPRILRFDGYEIDTARFELRRHGRRVPLEPRAFDLLLLLARNRRRTVTKDEIFGALWADRIVSDAALSSQVKAVRQALGDDGTAQHTIATVHGRGFRFVRPLDPPAAASDAAAQAPRRTAGRPVVAVLPLAAIGGDATLLADGLTEDVITALAKNRWLGVVARSPCFAFRGSSESIGAIGEKLGAGYLVMGSVRREGSRARTTVEIVDTRTSDALWSERFDREMERAFDLQDEISAVVASRIAIELGIVEQHKAARRPRAGRGAWDLYHLGVAEFYRFAPESNRRCQEHLREAIRLAPDFAEPHARLAYAIVLNMVYLESPVNQAEMDEALALALRGIELDDQDANGYFTLGRVRLARREYPLAIDALEQALDPCLALSYCGLGDSLAYENRLDEALEQFETAIELSPHDPFRWAFFSYRALAHLFRHDFAEAADWAGRAAQVPNAHYWAHAHLAAALGHLGDAPQAEAARAALLRARPGFTRAFARERLFYIKREDQIRTYLEGLSRAGIP